jgi:DNA-binding response OmpR family regulator
MEPLRQLDPAHELDGARILVVEDDFLISAELDTILAGAGAQVVGPCHTVAQANNLIEANHLSGAVLDFRLGQETSLPVARQLARHGVPFVFFTGQRNALEIWAECPDARVIAKPFQPRTILAAIADLLH